jgi:hypothetical protein
VNVDELPEVVQRLIREQVRTYEALEMVLLLHRHPDRQWRARDIAEAVRLSEEPTAAVLSELVGQQLIVESGGAGKNTYRLHTERPEVAVAVGQLATAWHDHRLAIIKLLNANALERLRTGAARALSDAFLFNRDKKDG